MRNLLTVLSLLALTTVGCAQWAGDDFEAYNPGSLCWQAGCANAASSGGWDGWYGVQTMAGNVDNTVTAHSGSQYLDVTNLDAVQPLSAIATGALTGTGATYTQYPQSGAWQLKAYAYVPTGGVGGQGTTNLWFIVNNTYDHVAAANWAHQIQFYDNAGTLEVTDLNGALAPVQALYDAWVEIIVEVCLDNNTTKAWINGTLFVDRTYSTGGAVEIANIDLFSNGGTGYFDTLSMTPLLACPAQGFQTNSPASSFDVDGVQGTPFGAGVAVGYSGITAHTANLSTNLVTVFDVALVAEPAYSSSTPPGLSTPGGQAININILSPTFLWLNGGTNPLVPTLLTHPGVLSLPFVAPPTALPLSVSGQQIVIDGASIEGFTVSGVAQITIEVCPLGVDEGFEAPTWGPGTFAPGWVTTNTNAGVINSWVVSATGTTPSGGTGPTSAYEGSQFIFYEASCPNTTGACGTAPPGPNIGTMESPAVGSGNEFSTSLVVNPALVFAVHALGGGITGNFSVEEYDQTNSMWVAISHPDASFSSQQSATVTDWKVKKVPLTDYGTTAVQFRFVYDTGLTATWQGDICIDGISICEQ